MNTHESHISENPTGTTPTEKSESLYYCDKLRIISKAQKNLLSRGLPLKRLSKECKWFQVDVASDVAQKYGYRSKIEVTAPTLTFFEILKDNKCLHSRKYNLSYIEIAQDSMCRSEAESCDLFEELFNYSFKRYTAECFFYYAKNSEDTDKEEIIEWIAGSENEDDKITIQDNYADLDIMVFEEDKAELYSGKSFYLGSKTFKFVCYPRISKKAKVPCIHKEWRIKGATTIKEKTGIVTVKDLLTFFSGRAEDWFEKTTGFYITQMEIDHEKHGRHFTKISVRKIIPKFKSQMRVLHSRAYCEANQIHNAAELKKHYWKEKRIVKKSKGSNKYAMTRKERRIHHLSSHKIQSFFRKH